MRPILVAAVLVGIALPLAHGLAAPLPGGFDPTGTDTTFHRVCGATEAGGDRDGVQLGVAVIPPLGAGFNSLSSGAMGIFGGGEPGSVVASGSATFGEIHLFVLADASFMKKPNEEGLVVARAEIDAIDGGVLGGLPAGTPIVGRFTWSIEGSFAGDGEAQFQVFLVDG